MSRINRWLTPQQMANDIARLDNSNTSRELNISQCSVVAKNIINLYKKDGKPMVVQKIRETLPSFSYKVGKDGLTIEQKDRVELIVKKMFKWHWLPWSRIRNNMRRLCD